jgi:hypothetical protein
MVSQTSNVSTPKYVWISLSRIPSISFQLTEECFAFNSGLQVFSLIANYFQCAHTAHCFSLFSMSSIFEIFFREPLYVPKLRLICLRYLILFHI